MIDRAGEIKRLVPMTRAAPFYGLTVSRAGFCCCPFHGEKTPSMKIYDGDRGYHCFGCHKGGSVIDFVMDLFGLSFVGAQKRLDADFNLGLFLDADDPNARQRAKIAAQARKQELAERDRKHRTVWGRYDSALTAFATADRLIAEAGRLPTWKWTDQHFEAFRTIDALAADLSEAETALVAFERENHVSGRPGGEKLIE